MSHRKDIKGAFRAHLLSKTVAQHAERDPGYAERIRQTTIAMQPILNDLAKIGFNLEDLSEIRHLGKSWQPAIPILLHWLPLVEDRPIKEDIIRSLSVPWTGNRATEYLIQEFRNTAVVDPYYAWTVGNALSIVDVKGYENEILQLCRNQQYGMARQMVVMNLHRLRAFPDAQEVALDLLEQDDVKLHAISALGRMRSKRALFQLEKLLADKQSSIRKEARKAITKIMREPHSQR